MSETKDKAELLIIANLAEQAERYDGKFGLRFQCFPRAFAHIQSGNTNYTFGKSSYFRVLITQSESRANSHGPATIILHP